MIYRIKWARIKQILGILFLNKQDVHATIFSILVIILNEKENAWE